MPSPGDCQVVKIAVEVGNENDLYTFDKTRSLDEFIQELCQKYNKADHKRYGLQLLKGGDKHYVTEDNCNEIVNGAVLKLIASVEFVIISIFGSEEDQKSKLHWLHKFSKDPAFVSKLSEDNLAVIRTDTISSSPENLFTYLVILNNISDLSDHQFVSENLVQYLTGKLKDNESTVDLIVILNILKLIGKMIVKFDLFYEVHRQLKTCDLLPYLWRKEQPDIQYYTLYILNRYVEYSPERKSIIEKLNLQQYKNIITSSVLENAKMHEGVAHELYVYQTHLLSLYEPRLIKKINVGLNIEPKTPNPSIDSRCSVLDFEETHSRYSSRHSMQSFSSIFENNSMDSTYFKSNLKLNSSNRIIGTNDGVQLRCQENLALLQPAVVSQLTSDCLDYYRVTYRKNFSISILESNHEPGFYRIADQITNIVCNILHIGMQPVQGCTAYQPLMFIADKKSFVEELFCRTLWLLSRTRREMRAKTLQDHYKVLPVLECQVYMALKYKPVEYKKLTDVIKSVTYENVSHKWEKERHRDWLKFLEEHPSLDDIKKQYNTINAKLIGEQRINMLKMGGKFPKIPEKKGKQQTWSIYLSKNRQKFTYGDCFSDGVIYRDAVNELTVADITYVVTGLVCPHIKDQRVKKELASRCFSLLFQEDGSLDFVAENESMASQWVDALNLLLGKPMTSSEYEEELKDLLQMDLNLHFLELQGVTIPSEPPPVPLPPPEYRIKPTVPPKPANGSQRITRPPTFKFSNENVFHDN